MSGRGGDQALSGGVALELVGVVVVPDPPDDLAPGATEDPECVLMAGAASACAVVDVSSPGVVASARVREIVERFAEAVVARPPEPSAF